MKSFKQLVHLDEMLNIVDGKWASVSKKDPSKVLQYYKSEGEPSDEWVSGIERRVQFFKHRG